MIEEFAAKLRKDLEADKAMYRDHLVGGGASDFTGYKVLCAKVEEVDRLISRVKDLENRYRRREGLIDD